MKLILIKMITLISEKERSTYLRQIKKTSIFNPMLLFECNR